MIPSDNHISRAPIRLHRAPDGSRVHEHEDVRDVMVTADEDGRWQVHRDENLESFEVGLWRDQPREKRVRRKGFLGWLGFTKKVVEAPNNEIEPDEVRSLEDIATEEKVGDSFRAGALPPEIQPKPWRAQHYEVRFKFQPDGKVKGETRLRGKATSDLSEIPMDLSPFPNSTYVVGDQDQALKHRREGDQLFAARPLKKGEAFELSVGYQGAPRPDSHPAIPSDLGWLTAKDSTVTMNGVENASTWMATDNDPSNKATYDFHLEVPKGHFAVANGELLSVRETDSGREFHYKTSTPMASHLASVNVFDEKAFTRTRVGKEMEVIHPRGMEEKVKAEFAPHDEMMEYLSQRLGPYPFASYGAIVAELPVDKHDFHFTDGKNQYQYQEKKYHVAFEAQTRPIYGTHSITGEGFHQDTLFHEMAHQWFGNSVGKASEKDIWVAEAFPSYAGMLWYEKQNGSEALEEEAQRRHQSIKDHAFTDTIANPDRDKVFSEANFSRMALSMHALRKTLGDEQFFSTLKGTLAEHRDQAVSTDQMAATMDRLNGGKLKGFFQEWLHSPKLPDLPK